MKTVRTSMSPKRAPVGEKGRRVARIDHFGASGKKSPDGTSLTVPSGRKVMRVVPRDRIPPLIGRDFFILEIEDFLRRNLKMDYSKTLHLPQTEFPMRGNLPKKEPEFVDFWQKNDLYEKS